MKTIKVLTIVAVVLVVATLGFVIYSHFKNKNAAAQPLAFAPAAPVKSIETDLSEVIE